MKTTGKFYIWMNQASANPYYWNQTAQNWTSNPREATFFDTVDEAAAEAFYADDYGPGEAIVTQATKDIPG